MIKQYCFYLFLTMILFSCEERSQGDAEYEDLKSKGYNIELYEKNKVYVKEYDTLYNYYYRKIDTSLIIDDKAFNSILIMQNFSRFSRFDTLGYFNLKGDSIMFFSREYKVLRKESKENKHYYADMNEQLFFNFNSNIGDTIKFLAENPFGGINSFRIEKIIFNKQFNDTIFECVRLQDKSTAYASDGGYFMHLMKIGKKVGFVELSFLDYDHHRLDVYLPKDSTWKLFD